MQNDELAEKIRSSMSAIGEHAMVLGTKAVVQVATGSNVLADAAAVGTRTVLDKSDPGVREGAGAYALYGAVAMLKTVVLVGGAPLVPAAVVVAGSAAIVGTIGYGFMSIAKCLLDDRDNREPVA